MNPYRIALNSVDNTRHQQALTEITEERVRQQLLKNEGKFPFTCADDIDLGYKLAVLTEELGEVARAICEITFLQTTDICEFTFLKTIDASDLLLTRGLMKKEMVQHLRKELIEVAAVATAWIESIDVE